MNLAGLSNLHPHIASGLVTFGWDVKKKKKKEVLMYMYEYY